MDNLTNIDTYIKGLVPSNAITSEPTDANQIELSNMFTQLQHAFETII
jgi:hypothetical protein